MIFGELGNHHYDWTRTVKENDCTCLVMGIYFFFSQVKEFAVFFHENEIFGASLEIYCGTLELQIVSCVAYLGTVIHLHAIFFFGQEIGHELEIVYAYLAMRAA